MYLIISASSFIGSHLYRYCRKNGIDIFDEFYNKIIWQEEIICLRDQSFCLTEAEDIAHGIVKALERGISGVYHLSSANYISRYELANLYAEKMFGGFIIRILMRYWINTRVRCHNENNV